MRFRRREGAAHESVACSRRRNGRSSAAANVAGVRPVIGICPAIEQARWGAWDQQALLLPRSYADGVERAGGLVMILAPDAAVVQDPDEVLDRVDGLLLAGGSDLDPASYGAPPHPETTGTVPERDAFELALTRRALERDLPFLGICRGLQILNVACGGTLHQHLPDLFSHHEHRRALGTFDHADHGVRLAPDSLVARLSEATRLDTKSHHHQGVDRLGEGLTETGWAEMDDLPEVLEALDQRFALGVQWHAEASAGDRIIGGFVAAAAEAARTSDALAR